MDLSKEELLLLAHLRQNARMSLTRLSRRTGIPISTIFDKIKKTGDGYIRRNTALVDFERLGFSVKVSILLAVGKRHKKDVGVFLEKFFNINSLARINNGFDFLLEAFFRNIRELEQFIESLDSRFVIKRKEVHYIIQDLKQESFLSDPDLIECVIQ